MNFSDLTEFVDAYDGDIKVLVRVGKEWHPVDAATVTAHDGGLAVRLEATSLDPPSSPLLRVKAEET